MKKSVLALIPTAMLLAGCNTLTSSNHQAQMQSSSQTADARQMAGRAVSEVNSLRERVRRVERAMIRLDRRMQVLERNELARISSFQGGRQQDVSVQRTSYANVVGDQAQAQKPRQEEASQPNFGQMTSPFARGAAAMNSYAPVPTARQVAARSSGVTDTLQAKRQAPVEKAAPSGFGRLPSLADDGSEAKKQDEDKSVAIWTVRYEPRKVWPGRDQLASSRQVVTALRKEDPVALYARGVRPSSKAFRERVRAISRYLGRVANVSSIPIASMPAEHLDEDTIEIIAAQ